MQCKIKNKSKELSAMFAQTFLFIRELSYDYVYAFQYHPFNIQRAWVLSNIGNLFLGQESNREVAESREQEGKCRFCCRCWGHDDRAQENLYDEHKIKEQSTATHHFFSITDNRRRKNSTHCSCFQIRMLLDTAPKKSVQACVLPA